MLFFANVSVAVDNFFNCFLVFPFVFCNFSFGRSFSNWLFSHLGLS